MHRIDKMESEIDFHQRDLEAIKVAAEGAVTRLGERLSQLHEDHYRLRETIGTLPSRSDLRDLELRIGERLEQVGARFDRILESGGR